MQKIKIQYFINDLLLGGAQTLLVAILKRIPKEEFEVEVVTLFPSGDHFEKEIEKFGIPVKSIGISKKREFLKAYLGLKKMIRDFQPDILNTFLMLVCSLQVSFLLLLCFSLP